MTGGETCLGAWVPERLRGARAAMRDHGRPISQQRFAALIGVSKRTLERYESTADPQPPKAQPLAAIVQVTGRPVDFFFAQPAAAAAAPTFEQALTDLLARAVEEATRPLLARIEILERQQAAEGWHGTTLTMTRRAA